MPLRSPMPTRQARGSRLKRPSPDVVLQLKIELLGVRPTVWRRIVVKDSIKLSALTAVILTAMGWEPKHMHEFVFGKNTYGIDYPGDIELEPGHEDRISLAEARGQLASFSLRYDFGDGWVHRIKVEKVLDQSPLAHAICVDGENACPPEDVGGPAGYAHFVQAMRDLGHADHKELIAWHGEVFDPAFLDIDAINARLKTITP